MDQPDYTTIRGLSDEEVQRRLREDGYNELPTSKKRSILAIAYDVVREPMFLLLVGCGSIYLLLGDVQEALILLGFVFVVIGLTLYQERKTERALEALRDLSSPRALVIRDGKPKRIPGREVVRGDILVLSEGDRVPADAVLASCTNLSVDESLLTGESIPVAKSCATAPSMMEMARPGGDEVPYVYSGTLVIRGQGLAFVKRTGVETELGKIGKSLQTTETEETLLQREVSRLVGKLAFLGLSLCAIVIVVYALSRGDWLHGFLAGITLAMAILPEEFPMVLTVFLALGAWRIARKRVLTRRVPVLETLGSATVLCVDKTGTLTQNRMSVKKIYANGKHLDLASAKQDGIPESFHEVVEFSILASQESPFDPMEKAFRELGELYLARTEHIHHDWVLVHEYPLSKDLVAMSHVWKSPNGHEYVISAKGAPEAVVDLCHLDKAHAREIEEQTNLMAEEGLRILGVAKATFRPVELPHGQHDFHFRFLGLVGLADPVRPNVADSIAECYTAGIRVVMITGDYPGTAQNIARQVGLERWDQVVTGSELEAMDESQIQEKTRTCNIFARVVPEQKLKLINSLKANGEIVAMTGDGVNDAPALKSAHIGLAMGGRGTDVAREAASLVLLDDDFSSIVAAIRMGRRIFDNLKKAMAYILAVHVPIAGLSLVPVLMNWPLILLPVHIVFLELIIDPACSIVFEAEPDEAGIMGRRPRDPAVPLFGWEVVSFSLFQGLSVLLIVLAVFVGASKRGLGHLDARALTFTTLILCNLGLILANRSWATIVSSLRRPNRALWWVLTGALFFLGMVLYVPFLRGVFGFASLHLEDLAICFAGGLICLLWFEALKVFYFRDSRLSAR